MQRIKIFISLIFFLAACQTANIPLMESPGPTPEPFITYQDQVHKFELKYSLEDYSADPSKYTGESFALFLDVNKTFAGKNLEEVRVNISVNALCRSINGYSPLTSDIEDMIIHGVGFTKYFAREGGTNTHTFEHTTYQTQHADHCYEFKISVREYGLTVFPDLSEYSKALLHTKLDPLIQSFKFLDS